MDGRNPITDNRLPEASEAFTDAIFAGADAIRRYERGRARRRAIALAAAAVLLVAAGLGAALLALRAPRPDAVIAARPDWTPSPTDAPTPKPTARAFEEPNTGLLVLTDAGPFEPGEWVVLTDEDGALDYGRIIPFHEQPSGDARAVEAVVGIQVEYLGDAGGGYAKVRFAGIDGYVEAGYLRRPPEAAAWDADDGLIIAEAALYITNSQGKVANLHILDDIHEVACYALKKLLDGASPSDAAYPDAPMGALLVVSLSDPNRREYRPSGVEKYVRVARFTLPCNGACVLQAEGGGRYTVSASDWTFFWSIFQSMVEQTWEP